jgi:hypothetical protein
MSVGMQLVGPVLQVSIFIHLNRYVHLLHWLLNAGLGLGVMGP